MKKPKRAIIRYSPEVQTNIINYFLNNHNNTDRAIAEHFGLNTASVCLVVTKYCEGLRRKMKSKEVNNVNVKFEEVSPN